ncbi:MAG: polysulfide reductase NrfD [Nitrospirae bacterium]|nr:polysulfide reductase NrfD [Nitrospirota bacterium]
MEVHGELWTLKELFVYPNEYIYWALQIVMYPLMTGLVAGAFVLSSLYHVFDRKELKEMSRFSLIFSYALLLAAPMPLLFHLLQPLRGFYVFLTPHFTSAIAAFGVVFFSYAGLVASEIWFVERRFFVQSAQRLRNASGIANKVKGFIYRAWSLGAYDISEEALRKDGKVIRVLAGIGVPVACFLHGYAGFIFGSVKANALWMTPLMPVIFIMSAIVSGIALCMLTYIIVLEINRLKSKRMKKLLPLEESGGVEMDIIKMTSKYLVFFMVIAVTLEFLDLVFRGYTAVKHWDILRTVIYERDFFNIFILQYGIGNLIPLVMLIMPGLTKRRAIIALILILIGVFMMRWNVVVGGQSFSLTLSGYMHYKIPIIPQNFETYKEGIIGALTIISLPFIFLWILSKVIPLTKEE